MVGPHLFPVMVDLINIPMAGIMHALHGSEQVNFLTKSNVAATISSGVCACAHTRLFERENTQYLDIEYSWYMSISAW